ncbi:hypothetical protein GCM10010387_57080 [Streptomyces inusitatus]|uniref:Secreted protein n=1 Tax=Streptomyces inusitatus TaxID=68221 RepID=A0A918V2J2_9ACTN|nr:hypothetical protein GCM10010387_57080 [Streptomyces inusitatus]
MREGRADKVPALLGPLTPAERKELLVELRALRAELRREEGPWGHWRQRGLAATGVLVAGAGCHTGAAAAAAWIGSRDLRISRPPGSPAVLRPLLEVLDGKDPGWLGDVAHRLAARASAEDDFPLIEELVRRAGCPAPATEGYVSGWLDARSPRSGGARLLREDPHTPALLPLAFDLAVLPNTFGWFPDEKTPGHWPSVLAGLAEAGVVERSTLVDGCVSRLLRGGRPSETGFFLNVLRRLAPTPEEERARIPDWAGMAADGGPQVAAHAQSALGRLAESGLLPVRALAEVTGAVLFRTEKKLVRTQLTLLAKVLRERAGDGETVAGLLPSVAEAFGHPDTGVQERALKLVARHLPAAGEELREDLAASAALLSPAHRSAAVAVFGALLPEEETAAHEEILPPPPVRERLPAPPASVAELVEEVLVLMGSPEEAGAYEWVLDGLVRLAHREREPLEAALKEAIPHQEWYEHRFENFRHVHLSSHQITVEVVVATLLGQVSDHALRTVLKRMGSAVDCPHDGLREITTARTWEAARLIRGRPVPFLLATPTWSTGALDAETLVERLRKYRRLEVEPAPVDFAQALLRVARGPAGSGDGTAARAAALGTPEGDRLAAWLSGGAPALTALSPKPGSEAGSGSESGSGSRTSTGTGTGTGTGTDGGNGGAEAAVGGAPEQRQAAWLSENPLTIARRMAHGMRERLAPLTQFPPAFRWLGRPLEDQKCDRWSCGMWESHWATVLPHDREGLALWMTHSLRTSGDWTRGTAGCLTALAESEAPEGPAGPELHRALAAGTGAKRASDRLAAVDAMLTLAARGQLDHAELGRELAHAVRHGSLKPNRLADALGTAAATGAYGTVWAVLAGALPPLLRVEPLPRALGEILAVASECAERCAPDGGPLPGLAELAGRGGSSQSAAQAARLLKVLEHGAGTPTKDRSK